MVKSMSKDWYDIQCDKYSKRFYADIDQNVELEMFFLKCNEELKELDLSNLTDAFLNIALHSATSTLFIYLTNEEDIYTEKVIKFTFGLNIWNDQKIEDGEEKAVAESRFKSIEKLLIEYFSSLPFEYKLSFYSWDDIAGLELKFLNLS